MFRNRASVRALFVVAGLVVASCSGAGTDEPPTTSPAETTTAVVAEFPVTVESAGVTVTIESRPTAIVSLSPTATEMLYAIGAGSQVVAVDEFSYFPPEAPVTDLSGFTPNLEAIVAYEPDLVVVSADIDGIATSLSAVGVPTLVLPTAAVIEDAYTQIRALGEATGNRDTAETLATDMEAGIDALVAGVAASPEALTYYHELGSDGGGAFYSVTSSTFIGEVFGAFGLENIADPADADGLGYPVLSVEFIIDADPDLIFFTSCCGDTPESIGERPGWDSISAVSAGAMHELEDDLASRWGPRLVEFFRLVADAVSHRMDG
ncbi:MAG TPA: ABC transporter substrate-binding protein [Acidimicrobiia bacterium]|nr:ABC transporter substrate-binding protein [Acidimicrobiia bacterium]